MSARVLPEGVGREWRGHFVRAADGWSVDTRRACGACGRSFRECGCFDAAPSRDDAENSALDREVVL